MERFVRRRQFSWSVGLLLLVTALAGCSGDPDPGATGSPIASPSPTQSQLTTTVLDLRAEGLTGPLPAGTVIPDTSGRDHDGLVMTSSKPVALQATQIADEAAIQFPKRCTRGTCAKAVIEVPSSIDLIPGVLDFAWGARVFLKANQTSEGSNILQKGFASGGGAEWKLQVDGVKGHPSCTLVGRGDSVKHLATSRVTIADGKWHDVVCQRMGETLTIEVDGVVRGETKVAADLVVSPQGDVRVGGKNVKEDNDQYSGAISAVFVRRA